MGIRLLDCTLRDGGHVNNAVFGKQNIQKIITLLSKSGVDIIELGFLMDGQFTEHQSHFNCVEQILPFLDEANPLQEYSLMIRPDWYDIKQLTSCQGKISTIRFAFYFKDLELLKQQIEIARSFGYRIILNPVNILSYSENELDILLTELNDIKPDGVTIVDTCGSLMKNDLTRIYEIFEKKIDLGIEIGLHLHENMSLSFSLAQEFLSIRNPERSVIIDGSLLGMGRIPGNLCIEVLMSYFNSAMARHYDLLPVLDLIDTVIEPIKQITPWGYSPAYFLTGLYQVHRSYAEYLLIRNDITLSDIDVILQSIHTNEDKNFYNKSLIKQLTDTHSFKNKE